MKTALSPQTIGQLLRQLALGGTRIAAVRQIVGCAVNQEANRTLGGNLSVVSF